MQTKYRLYLVLDFVNGGHLFFQLYRQGLFRYGILSFCCLLCLWCEISGAWSNILLFLLQGRFGSHIYCRDSISCFSSPCKWRNAQGSQTWKYSSRCRWTCKSVQNAVCAFANTVFHLLGIVSTICMSMLIAEFKVFKPENIVCMCVWPDGWFLWSWSMWLHDWWTVYIADSCLTLIA